ncbi:hypothetical protein [Flavobacterium muglaense]|uniref:Beta-carotene 15,15'-monooxygenase n=1 Tax=Flavobacterium muglaense TaxID=2764716 RepID=A0A923MY73_9FLAO|nr:hypothetical protein [Flavobacterium muglaense]MBC5837118.1 hypothetical protein [Flavobacterium muglaense]MBC5843647.1 hypothetical protein [Flavobacterium muglaense]
MKNKFIKKYLPLLLFIIVQIIIAGISLNGNFRNDYKYSSILTGLFLFLTPTVYHLLSKNTKTTFTYWFVFYLSIKISPFIFTTDNNFFKILFEYKIYLNIAFLIYLLYKTIVFIVELKKRLFQKNTETIDDFSIISNSLGQSIKFEKLGKLLTFEICSFYYCFIKWVKNKKNDNQFTTNNNSGITALYIGLMIASITEAFAIRSILISRNKTAAIVLLVLHLYILINLTGHLKAIHYRYHLVSAKTVVIRYGLFETLVIPIDTIASIKNFEGDYTKNKDLVKFALLGKLEPHNIAIELKEKRTVNLPFGISRQPTTILLYVDEIHDFINTINIETSA